MRSLKDQIIDAFGEAAKNGGITGSGDGKIAMASGGWDALGPLLDSVLAAAKAKGRAEGIEEAAKVADDWLQIFGAREPKHVSAQTWACDAVRDIAEVVRELSHTKEATDVTG